MNRGQKPAEMAETDWQELIDASDRICDALEDVPVGIALAAIGNVVCGMWQAHGDDLPYSVMADWLRQVFIHTKAMRPPTAATKH
jgi:hypothetical protein